MSPRCPVLEESGRKECLQDRRVTDEEGSLVQLLSAKPRSDLAIVFARIARGAGWDDVLQRVAATARDRQDAVALHGNVRHSAVRAAAPCVADAGPLVWCEIVVHACQALLSALGIPCASRSRLPCRRELTTGRHMLTVLRRPLPTRSMLPRRGSEMLCERDLHLKPLEVAG